MTTDDLWKLGRVMCGGDNCGRVLSADNVRIADGCPCNNPRGINHGVVPKYTCTCVECDPEQTGSTRYPATPMTSDHTSRLGCAGHEHCTRLVEIAVNAAVRGERLRIRRAFSTEMVIMDTNSRLGVLTREDISKAIDRATRAPRRKARANERT